MHLLQSNRFSGAENVVCQIISLFQSDDNIEMTYVCPDGPIRTELEKRNIPHILMPSFSQKEIVKVAQDQRPSDWSIIVKKYNNMMDIPVLKVGYDKRADYYDNEIALIIEENNWKTIEARAKKMNEQVKEELKLQQQRDQKEKENKEAEYKKHMIAKYGSPFGEFVANKQVAVGMTKEMCRDAWGAPINTYRTTTSLGQSEVWCYDYKTRVYFYGNKVTRIED